MYRRLIALACIAGIGVFFINILADTFYWYVTIPYFDKAVHALGGAFVALAGSAAFFRQSRQLHARDLLITILLFVFIVGLLWEYYEYAVQFYIKSVHLADTSDSIGDLICDIIGGIIGVSFVIMLKKRYNRE